MLACRAAFGSARSVRRRALHASRSYARLEFLKYSAVKGWSHAERLNELLRELLCLSVKFNCILVYEWISTHANLLADPLSRLDEPLFLTRAAGADSPIHGPLARHPDAGTRRGGA